MAGFLFFYFFDVAVLIKGHTLKSVFKRVVNIGKTRKQTGYQHFEFFSIMHVFQRHPPQDCLVRGY